MRLDRNTLQVSIISICFSIGISQSVIVNRLDCL